MKINDLIATEYSDILGWKVPYNLEKEYYQITSTLVFERASQKKAMLICICLSTFFHLLEQQEFQQWEFRNGVQEACNRVIKNFLFFFFSRPTGPLQDDFFKVVNKYYNWELTSANSFPSTRAKPSHFLYSNLTGFLTFSSYSLSSLILPHDFGIVILRFSNGCPYKFQIMPSSQRGHTLRTPPCP